MRPAVQRIDPPVALLRARKRVKDKNKNQGDTQGREPRAHSCGPVICHIVVVYFAKNNSSAKEKSSRSPAFSPAGREIWRAVKSKAIPNCHTTSGRSQSPTAF